MIAKIEEKFVETKGSKYLYGLLLVSIVFGYASYKCFIEIYDFFIPHLIVRYMEPSWLTVLFSFVFSLATFFSILGIAKSKYSKQKYGKIVYRKLFFCNFSAFVPHCGFLYNSLIGNSNYLYCCSDSFLVSFASAFSFRMVPERYTTAMGLGNYRYSYFLFYLAWVFHPSFGL